MPSAHLHHHEQDPQSSARRRVTSARPRDTCRVQSLATSAKRAPQLGNPEWMADLEYVWRMRTHAPLQRLNARAARQRGQARRSVRQGATAEAVKLRRSAEWSEHRAQAMALPRAELLAACGTRWRKIACKCGPREVKVGCGQVQLCEKCRARSWRKWRRKLVRSLDAHVRAARGAWARTREGMLPGVYLVTLTVAHSGSIETDRAELGKAWRRLSKVAQREQWWGAYALTVEVTPGRDGLGHVHLHLAAISSWIPYERLHEVWREVSGARVLDVRAPRAATKAARAADYLSKYVTKGVDPSVFTGAKAGELIVAMRGRRRVTTSVRFWEPVRDRDTCCPTCGERTRSLGAPESLRVVAPAAVLKAMAERIGWWIPRGGVQCELKHPIMKGR